MIENVIFDGQQSGEIILAVLKEHKYRLYLNIVLWTVLTTLFFVIFMTLGLSFPMVQILIRLIVIIFCIIFLTFSIIWSLIYHYKTVTYITDRRIIRFEAVSPFFCAKRALFWTEVLKAKAFSPNLLWRLFKIGSVIVEPEVAISESVQIRYVYLFEDIANYIDKIIYLVKNKPSDLVELKPFIFKKKGLRET
jgi:hypothetical protein